MKSLSKKLVFFALIILMFLQGTVPVFAAGELQIKSDSGKPFLFQPKAGEIINSKVFVRNLSARPVRVKLYPRDAVTTSDGRFDLLREDQASKNVGTWIQLSKDQLYLQAGENIEVPFTLRMPKRLEPGQYIGGIVVQGEPITGNKSKEGVTFNLLPRTGIFVTVNAPGQQVKALNISEFSGNVNYAGDEAVFNVELANMGNMTLNPDTYIDIKNEKGKTVKKVDMEFGFLTGGQKVTRQIRVDDVSHFGAANAELVVSYADGKTSKASTRILFIPGLLLTVVGTGILTAAAGGLLVAKKFDIQISKKDNANSKSVCPNIQQQ